MRKAGDEFYKAMLALNQPRNRRVGKKAAGRSLGRRDYLELP